MLRVLGFLLFDWGIDSILIMSLIRKTRLNERTLQSKQTPLQPPLRVFAYEFITGYTYYLLDLFVSEHYPFTHFHQSREQSRLPVQLKTSLLGRQFWALYLPYL